MGNCVCCTAVGVRAADTLTGRDGCVVTWAGNKKLLLVQALLGAFLQEGLGISAGVRMSFLCSTASWSAVWNDWEGLKKAWENKSYVHKSEKDPRLWAGLNTAPMMDSFAGSLAQGHWKLSALHCWPVCRRSGWLCCVFLLLYQLCLPAACWMQLAFIFLFSFPFWSLTPEQAAPPAKSPLSASHHSLILVLEKDLSKLHTCLHPFSVSVHTVWFYKESLSIQHIR